MEKGGKPMANGFNADYWTNPHRVSDPERIPAVRYYDEDFYRAECEKVWPHVWQMACRLEQIPNPGDWVEYSNLGKSVIVVRTRGGIKAYHNACRHRGVQLAHGHGNCEVQGFICPFHGWRFNIEGKNTFVYGRHMFSDRQLDQADLNLKPCRVELWGGCAFINHDDNAPSFRASIGPVADRLEAHGVGHLRAEWWYATVLPANWKTAMEAFMEGYHVMRTHPQLQLAAPSLYNARYGNDTGGIGVPVNPKLTGRENVRAYFKNLELVGQGMAGQVHAKEVAIARELLDVDLPEDPAQAVGMWFGVVQDQISKQLRAKGERVPDLNSVAVSDPVEAVEFIFPHYFLLPIFTSMASYRVRPLGPESCLFETWALTQYPEGEEPPPPMEPIVLPYNSDKFPPIPQQDYSNIPLQQKGLHADGFQFMRLSKDIEGLISNYQRLIDGYLDGVAFEKLAKATHLLGGNFDGKIADLGF
jgi:nitrite reductase/ring-hydroxylating ferredoxin subunit